MLWDAIVHSIKLAFCEFLYAIEKIILWVVQLIDKMFNVFSGANTVTYQDKKMYLTDVFMTNNTISVVFWGVALIGIVFCFAFTIISIFRKMGDLEDEIKKQNSDILISMGKTIVMILCLSIFFNICFKVTNTLMDRLDFLFDNANNTQFGDGEKTFSDEEYATMARIVSEIANYSVNPSYNSRYNLNSCFNSIRGDINNLSENGFFNYDYQLKDSKHYSWQGALQLIANAVDTSKEVNLDVYNDSLSRAILTTMDEINNNPDFKPVANITRGGETKENVEIANILFLTGTSDCAYNGRYNKNPSYQDPVRNGYYTGKKDIFDIDQVEDDFDLTHMDFLIVYIVGCVYIYIIFMCNFNLIIRLFNLIFLYISAPLLISPTPLDNGAKYKQWLMAFIMQLFSAVGLFVAMRLYIIYVPIIFGGDLTLFNASVLDFFAKVLLVIGGAYAVLQANNIVVSILGGIAGFAMTSQISGDLSTGKMMGTGIGSGAVGTAGIAWSGLKTAGSFAKGLLPGGGDKAQGQNQAQAQGQSGQAAGNNSAANPALGRANPNMQRSELAGGAAGGMAGGQNAVNNGAAVQGSLGAQGSQGQGANGQDAGGQGQNNSNQGNDKKRE